MATAGTPKGFRHHGPDARGEAVLRLPAYLLELCRELRRQGTAPEQTLWRLLRGRQLRGLKFRRQHTIGRYVVDFYCHEARLVVELDGSPHDEERQAEYDRVRDQELRHIGLQVLRFSNEELSADVEGVLQRIADAAGERRPSPPTPLPGGEG